VLKLLKKLLIILASKKVLPHLNGTVRLPKLLWIISKILDLEALSSTIPQTTRLESKND
jgi:hypothetical protein